MKKLFTFIYESLWFVALLIPVFLWDWWARKHQTSFEEKNHHHSWKGMGLLLFLSIFTLPNLTHAAIAYNSTSAMSEDAASATTVTLSHTCNAADVKLVALVTGRDTATGVTYNGVAMTKIIDETAGYQKTSIWYLDNPATGSAHNIVATFTAATTNRAIVAVGMSGTATGIGASATNSGYPVPPGTGTVTLTTSITTNTANSDILDLWFDNNVAPTYGAGETELVKAADSFHGIAKKSTTTAGSNSVAITVAGGGSATNATVTAVEIPIFVAASATPTSILGLVRSFWIW